MDDTPRSGNECEQLENQKELTAESKDYGLNWAGWLRRS